ncbi:hypothetical protein ABBQ38_009993 [Trebouxia sp. C0009 RCD-2024]
MSLEVDVQLLLKDPKTALFPVLRKINGWEQAASERVTVSQISGAMTNLVYRCDYDTPAKTYHALARVFGSAGGLFGREDEQQVFSAVADAGLGPRVLVLFAEGRIEEFIEAQSVSAELMATPEVAVSIAAAMAHFHFSMLKHFTLLDHLPSCMSPVAQIWDRLRDWTGVAGELYKPDELQRYGLSNIRHEIDTLQHTLTAMQPGWLGFCHNDLQYGNMLLAATTTSPERKCLLPADDNVTQGWSREDALSNVGDSKLGSSADLDPVIANLLSENLEGLSPQKAGKAKGAFWDGHPSFNKTSASGREDPATPVSPPVSPKRKEQIPDAALEALDPAQVLTDEHDEDHESADQPDSMPSQLQIKLRVSTKATKVPVDAHIRLIDYEYAGVNPVALDVANHWCEYAADYHTDAPHVLDYSKFPDQQHQQGFVHAYIETVHSMSRKHGDKLTWDGQEVAYSAPAPGAMQIHTDTDCNQSLYSKAAISTSLQGESGRGQGMANASSSAPAAHEGELQGSLDGPGLAPFHKHSSVQKLKEAVIDNVRKVVGSPAREIDGECEECKPGDKACADHVEPLLPELLRRKSKSEDLSRIKEQLHEAALAYVPVSHLMWGLWGLIQAKTSNCDYDFVEYARQRLQQYHATKPDMNRS